MQPPIRDHKTRGFIVLFAALSISVVAILLSVSVLLLSGNQARSVSTLETSLEAHAFADACMELALLAVHSRELFAGTDSVDFNEGRCEYGVIVDSSHTSTLTSSGNVGSVTRKVKTVVETKVVVSESGTTTDIISAVWTEPVSF